MQNAKLEYKEIRPTGRVGKDMSKIVRGKKDSEKLRSKPKEGVNLAQVEIDRVVRMADREKELGELVYCKAYKGNRLMTINKFLYDTYLQPKERICYRYVATPTQCKGLLRDKSEVRVMYKDKEESETFAEYKPYVLYIGGNRIGEYKNQPKVIERIKKYLNI